MDTARAKEFIYYDIDEDIIYLSTDLQKLIDLHPEHDLTFVYGVVDTESGEKLFEMDFAYSGEPILMRVFLHKDYYMEYHSDAKIVRV